MSTKENKLNECPTCEKSPCACPAKGGDAAEEKDKNKTSSTAETSIKSNVVNAQEKLDAPVENRCAELLAASMLTSSISFFGGINNNATRAEAKLSNNAGDVGNAVENNSVNTASVGMGMSIGSANE